MAYDAAGNFSPASATVRVTTPATSGGDTTAPLAPMLLRPIIGDIVSTVPTFIWRTVTDPSGVTYELQVADGYNFFAPWIVVDVVNINTDRYTPSSLTAGRNYYWRVRAIDGSGNVGPWSSVEHFFLQ